MSVETSSQEADAAGVPLPAGMTPADLMAELVTALPERDGEDYLVYELHRTTSQQRPSDLS